MVFLGVDGGGTKTAFCLLSDDGRVVARAETGSTSVLSVGLEEAERRLGEGVALVCGAASIDRQAIEHAFFGLPGYGEVPSIAQRLEAMPRSALGHDRYGCGNDMICGWAGSLACEDGINVIAGTGSMTYGENRGRGARCGGWGEIFGDEGSAYWIGREALQAFSRMSDGREARSALHDILARHLELADDLALVDVVLNRWKGDRARIAELARLVDDAAAEDDGPAGKILDRAAGELVLLAQATRRSLGFMETERVPLTHSGGVFGSERLRKAFEQGLAEGLPYDLRRPLFDPALGGALYAARSAGRRVEPVTD